VPADIQSATRICTDISYLADLCWPVASVGSRQRLQFATRDDLVISPTVLYIGVWSFTVAGPKSKYV